MALPANVASAPRRTQALPAKQQTPVIPPQNQQPIDAAWQADFFNPARRMGLFLACLFVFFRFNMLHEALGFKYGTNAYILVVTGFPALFALVLSGGLGRTMKSRLTWYWLGFVFCLIIASLLSTWRAVSLDILRPYLRTEFPMLFMIAGMIMTWTEYWRLLQLLAGAAFIDLLIGKVFASMNYDRVMVGMTNGSVADPNDFAAHLLLLLPFLLMVVFTPGRNFILRLVCLGGCLYGLYFALATGSRGALAGVVITIIYAAFRLPGQYRFFLLVILPIIAVGCILTLPRSVLVRFSALTASDEPTEESVSEIRSAASSSMQGRIYVLKQTIAITLKHPIFGVGPGEFADSEGLKARAEGRQGAWHNTHNTYTQVSSEVGVPAFFLYIAAILGTFGLANKTYRQARQQPPTLVNKRIMLAAFCLMLSIVAFCASVFFLSFAYKFHMPALTGLSIALWKAAQHEWSQPQTNQTIA